MSLALTLRIIKRNPALQLLGDVPLQLLAKHSEVKHYVVNDKVVTLGNPQAHILLIGSGTCKLYRRNSAKKTQVLVAVARAPSIVGDTEYYSGREQWMTSIKTVTEASIVFMPVKTFQQLVDHNTQVAAALYRDVCSRHMLAIELVQILALQSTRNKILRLLWTRIFQNKNEYAKLALTEIANVLGLNRKTIARTLLAMQQEGVLKRQGQRFALHGPAASTPWKELRQGFGFEWHLP